MSTVLIDSMDTALARHLLALVREDPAVERIVDSGFPSGASIDDGAGTGAVDVVLTAPGAGPDRDGSRLGGVDTDGAARLLERLDHLPMRSLGVVSSGMVYGGWPANPVPIGEGAGDVHGAFRKGRRPDRILPARRRFDPLVCALRLPGHAWRTALPDTGPSCL